MINQADLTFPADMLDPAVGGVDWKRYKHGEMPGCYAFYDADTLEVAYVGKALQVKKRLTDHWFENEKLFDWMVSGHVPAVAVWYCDHNERIALEQRLIAELRPLLNVQDAQ